MKRKGVIILNMRIVLFWMVTRGQRSEDGEGRSHVNTGGKKLPGRGKNKCKNGLKAGICLVCSINNK